MQVNIVQSWSLTHSWSVLSVCFHLSFGEIKLQKAICSVDVTVKLHLALSPGYQHHLDLTHHLILSLSLIYCQIFTRHQP